MDLASPTTLAAGRDLNRDLELFAIGGDHAVWVKIQSSPGKAFAGWWSLGGYVNQIAVGTDVNGDLYVFAVGGDGAAWYCKQHGKTDLSFDDWSWLGGSITQVTTANQANGDLYLFGLDESHTPEFRHESTP